MGLQATHLCMRRCNLKSSQLLLLLAHLSPPGAGVQVWGGGGVVSEQAQQPGGPQVPGGRGPGRSKGQQEAGAPADTPRGVGVGPCRLGSHFALHTRSG